MKRKNIIAVTLCAAVIFSLGACQKRGKETETTVQVQVESESDYREADAVEQVEIDGRTVNFKEAEGKILTVVWTDGDYCYAISSSAGIEAESMTGLVQSLK